MRIILSNEQYQEIGSPDINDRIKVDLKGFRYSGLIVGLRYLSKNGGVSLNLWQVKINPLPN